MALRLTGQLPREGIGPATYGGCPVRRGGVDSSYLLVETYELDDPRYAANPVNRCYFCKTEVYSVAVEHARRFGIRHVLDGFNVDDRGDHRSGRKAARLDGTTALVVWFATNCYKLQNYPTRIFLTLCLASATPRSA